MDDTGVQINFAAPAVLRKWPSLNNERVSASLGARPYLVADGTLDECIRQFLRATAVLPTQTVAIDAFSTPRDLSPLRRLM